MQDSALPQHRPHRRGGGDVGQRVGVEDQHVRGKAGREGPEPVAAAEQLGGGAGGGVQDRCRGQPGRDQQRHLTVDPGAGGDGPAGGVGPGAAPHAGVGRTCDEAGEAGVLGG